MFLEEQDKQNRVKKKKPQYNLLLFKVAILRIFSKRKKANGMLRVYCLFYFRNFVKYESKRLGISNKLRQRFDSTGC